MTADPRARWAEQFGIPADAPPDEAAAAFLRSLPADLVPMPVQALAAGELAGAELPTGLENGRETALDADVEAFAGRFWSLSPAERLLDWDRLSHRGANPVRLRELEPGLDAAPAALGDPVAEELAEQFRTLFVLPPRARAIRRAQWLLAHADGIDRWRSALLVVQRDAPALVALEPRLRTALDPTFDPAALVAGAQAPPVEDGIADFTRRLRQSEASEPSKPRTSRRARGEQFGQNFVLIFLAIMASVAVNAIRRPNDGRTSHPPVPDPGAELRRALSELARRGSTAPDRGEARGRNWKLPSGQRDTGPAVESKPSADGEWAAEPRGPALQDPDLTPADRIACIRYEQELTAGRPARRPPAYERWLQTRPGTTEPVGERVRLDLVLVTECQQYDRGGGARPARYTDWVKAGKPSTPGEYTVPR
ncbi:hypothetical protein R5W23_004132 [Gemmata sp. JC673]|uniref:Uncharacterized protein n=1 Tax=Gemmata algarum TaxID=2975278 RepID=A0ABU5F6A8_9BACT|nr:hypothetical protein [Gemmata algarum]MDY3562658.1 hypothetical protein [Gemmata algarum]